MAGKPFAKIRGILMILPGFGKYRVPLIEMAI